MGTLSLRTFHVLSLCWDDERDKIKSSEFELTPV